MTPRRFVIVACVSLGLVGLVGCSKPKSLPAAQPAASMCPKVADHLVSLMSGATKHPADATDPLRRVIDERCERDAWSAETKQCLLALASLSDGERCQKMMTPAQVDAFHRDSEAATVELRARMLNRNYVGSHFGGSIYAMTDPFFMIMMMQNLGRDYIVWDKAGTVRYLKPARGTVTANFRLDEADVARAREATANGDKY